jgi:hypothetical protein
MQLPTLFLAAAKAYLTAKLNATPTAMFILTVHFFVKITQIKTRVGNEFFFLKMNLKLVLLQVLDSL